MKGSGILVLIVLGLSLGSGALWFVRERERRALGQAPEIEIPAIVLASERAVSRGSAAPGLVFDVEPLASEAAVERVRDAQPEIAAPAADRRVDVALGAVPDERHMSHLATAFLAALEARDQDQLVALRDQLTAGGNASIPVLQDLLTSGIWRAEHFAMSMLARLGTPEARIAAVGHMLTRPGTENRGWHRLARRVGHAMDGNTVDLVVGMLGDAQGETQRRLLALLQNARSEDALFRLYMIGDEHPNEQIRQVAINTVFRGRRPGGIELLKDIMLTHTNPEVSAMAAIGLAEVGRNSAVQFLAQAGNGTHPEAEVARWALEQARRPQSHGALLQIANDSAYAVDVRLAAVRALGTSRSRRRVNRYLAQLAGHADADAVREAAADFLQERTQ